MPGFGNRFRSFLGRAPAVSVNAVANTTALSNALKKYVTSIRTLRNTPGITKNQVINAAKTNSGAVNSAIVNYVMKINKANYAKNKVNTALPAVTEGLLPGAEAEAALKNAANANRNLAAAQAKLKQAVTNANRFRGLNVNKLENAAKQFNTMNAPTKNSLRLALNEKLKTLNKTSQQYNRIQNIQAKIGGRTAAAFVGPATNQPLTRSESLIAHSQRQQAPPQAIEKTIKAPNGRNIVVLRENNKARWNFKNDANKAKYNLNNRNKNTPVIRKNVNLNASALYGN